MELLGRRLSFALGECSAAQAEKWTVCHDWGSSNGRTADSDSASLGPDPSPPANFWLDIPGSYETSCGQRLVFRVTSCRIRDQGFLRFPTCSRRFRATRLRHGSK